MNVKATYKNCAPPEKGIKLQVLNQHSDDVAEAIGKNNQKRKEKKLHFPSSAFLQK